MPYPSKIPVSVHPEILDRYTQGESATQLAHSYQVSRHVITRILHRHQVPVRHATDLSQYARQNGSTIAERWDHGGVSMETLASEYHTSIPTIQSILDDYGLTERQRHRGPKNPSWKGGRRVDSTGYVYVWADPEHPFFSMSGGRIDKTGARYFLEHRLTMAESIGRPLSSQEQVHHINGNRSDNRIENLQLRTTAHGSGVCGTCLDCGSHRIDFGTIADA